MLDAKKGQSSLEQLIVIAMGISIITAIFYFAMNYSTDNMRISQAQDMVEKLAKSADYVYSMGPGSKDVVDVYVPSGMVFANITNTTIWVRLALTSGESDVFEDAKPILIGELPFTPGPHEIPVTHTQSGKVMLGEGSLSCRPYTITRSFMQGENGTSIITIKNVGEYPLANITATLDGNILDMTTLTQPSLTLDPEESSIVRLDFGVADEKTPGSYSGTVIVSAEIVGNTTQWATECSTFVTLFVRSSKPADDTGPIVVLLEHKPRNPSIYSPVKIKATGDDSATGGSVVELCQVELDGSGIWNDMAPIDGAYDEVIEGVDFTFGTLGEGFHFVNVRCIDEYMNIGPTRQDNFTVRFYVKEILFITMDSSPNAEEQLWIDWLDSHSSIEGFQWNYDQMPKSDVTNGTVDPGDYQVVLFANYPNTDTALNTIMISYMLSGHYVVLLGEAMKFGVPNLDVGSGNAGTHAKNSIRVQTDHYITAGYDVLSAYNITNGDWDIYYHPSFEAMNIISMDDSVSRIVVGDASFLVSYGPTRPDMLTYDGDTFAVRVIDHALLES